MHVSLVYNNYSCPRAQRRVVIGNKFEPIMHYLLHKVTFSGLLNSFLLIIMLGSLCYLTDFFFISYFVNHFIVAPPAPSGCNITLLYSNRPSGRLLFITSTWDSMPVSSIMIMLSLFFHQVQSVIDS